MADNETSYLPIGTCLEQIEHAVYGREVRKAIHDGIAQCYDDTVEGVNAAQQAASDTQEVIDNAVIATREANTAAAEASNVKVEQTVSGDTVTFTTTKRDGTTVSTSFQKPNIVVSKDEGSGEFSVTGVGWNGEEIIAKIPDPSEEVKSRATIAAVSSVKTALGNPLTITDGMDAPAVKTVVTLEPKQDLHGYDHLWVGGSGTNLFDGEWETGEISATTGENFNNSGVRRTVNYIPIQPNTEYRIVCSGASGTVRARFYKADKTYIGTVSASGGSIEFNAVFVSPAEAYFTRFAPNGDNIQYIDGFALNYPSSVTTYEPYSNICPIEGYDTVRVTATGKNLYDPHRFVDRLIGGTTTTVMSDGTIHVEGQSTTSYRWEGISENLELEPGTYVFGRYGTGYGVRVQNMTDATVVLTITDNETVTYKPFTITKKTALSFAIVLNNGQNYDFYAKLALYRADDISNEWEPFGSTTSFSVAQAAGATVYGGTVTLNEDGSGTLVVDRGIEVITKDSPIGKGTKDSVWYLNKTIPMAKLLDYRKSLICDTVEVRQNHGVMTNNLYNVPGITGYGDNSNGYPNSNWIYFTDGKSTTNADIIAWLTDHPLSVVYPLRTIATYSLTADQLRTLTGENHVWTDGTRLELTYRADKYADVEKFLNAIPTGTKTGEPAVFADGADDLPFEKLTIAVEPHQEGTGDPSPDNIRPITGWDEVKVTRCGKNLLDANKITPVTTGSGTRQGVEFTKPGTYVISAQNGYTDATSTIYVTLYDGSSYSSGTPIVVGITKYSSFYRTITDGQRLIVHGGSGINAQKTADGINVCRVQLEYGTTATDYEPFQNSTTLPISLKYATGSTVYGGTVTINRDGAGSVVVNRAIVVFDGDENWNLAASDKAQFLPVSTGLPGVDTSAYEKVICSHLKMRNSIQSSDMSVGEACYNGTNANWLVNMGFTSVADLKAYLASSPMTVSYPLATPTTYTLTAPQLTSLLGNNTVWCDAGQVTVKYKRDIGKMISNLYAMLVDTGAIVIENEEDVTVEGPGYP